MNASASANPRCISEMQWLCRRSIQHRRWGTGLNADLSLICCPHANCDLNGVISSTPSSGLRTAAHCGHITATSLPPCRSTGTRDGSNCGNRGHCRTFALLKPQWHAMCKYQIGPASGKSTLMLLPCKRWCASISGMYRINNDAVLYLKQPWQKTSQNLAKSFGCRYKTKNWTKSIWRRNVPNEASTAVMSWCIR